jgi:hypothetical protein
VARETNVSIARLSEWRGRALAGAATALKERERDDRDDEIARLKSKVGEMFSILRRKVARACSGPIESISDSIGIDSLRRKHEWLATLAPFLQVHAGTNEGNGHADNKFRG